MPTLSHLQKQKISSLIQWELILVDNASTDDTVSVAKKQWQQEPLAPMHVVYEKEPGLMSARKKGVKATRYPIVSFVDDDNWL